jgi:proteasome lid subunit RPN8/RPN11
MSDAATFDDPGLHGLPPGALSRIYGHARATYPEECCGWLRGRGPTATLHACANRQNRLHELDPGRYPRTAREAYEIGGRELLDLVESFASPQPASIIYHSHPDVGAYFSAEDTRAALAAGYPVDYLVVDVRADAVVEAKLFRREGEGFVEVARFGPA